MVGMVSVTVVALRMSCIIITSVPTV
jgi:hypothetical protein